MGPQPTWDGAAALPFQAALECNHVVCGPCLVQMATLASSERSYAVYMRCPDTECRRLIEPGALAGLGLPAAGLKRLAEVHANMHAARRFVRSCDASLDAMGGDDELDMLGIARENSWARCDCGFVIERAGGCSHMVCRCGRHFCYSCNKELDAGSRYTCVSCVSTEAAARPAVQMNVVPVVPATVHVLQRGRMTYVHVAGRGCPVCGRTTRKANGGRRAIENMQHHMNDSH